MDGVAAHAINEAETILDATLEVSLLKGGRIVARASNAVLVPARGALTRSVDAIVGQFTDHANAYRFGPPKVDAVAVALRRNGDGTVLAQDVHFPLGLSLANAAAAPKITAASQPAGDVLLEIESAAFLQSVRLVAPGFVPDDNYFHVIPGTARRILLRARDPGARFEGTLEALNLAERLHLPPVAASDPAQGDLGRG